MDEIDAIGGRRFSEGSSADREIQRTLMEVKNYFSYFFCSFFFYSDKFNFPFIRLTNFSC